MVIVLEEDYTSEDLHPKPDFFIYTFLGLSKDWYVTKHITKRIRNRSRNFIGHKRKLSKSQERVVKGYMGEEMFPSNCRQSLRQLGLVESQKGYTNTFKLTNFTTRNKSRPDYYLKINYNDIIYKLLIEVKNWGSYDMYRNEKYFNTKILKRFIEYDPSHLQYWILAINKRLVPHIKAYCDKNDILILPFNEHYTRSFIKKLVKENRLDQISNPENILTS